MLDLVSGWTSLFQVCPVRYPSRVQKFFEIKVHMHRNFSIFLFWILIALNFSFILVYSQSNSV